MTQRRAETVVLFQLAIAGLMAISACLPALASGALPHPCVNPAAQPIEGTISPRLEIDGRLGGGTGIAFSLEADDRLFKLGGIVFTGQPPPLEAAMAVTLFPIPDRRDRYGRLVVQAFERREDGRMIWLQGQILSQGAAIHDGREEPGGCLLAYEQAEERAGLPPQDAANVKFLLAQKGHFIRVTGEVFSVGDREKRLYLNFGQKWRQDFTVTVEKTGKRRYKGSLTPLVSLAGRRVTVRGMLEEAGGPMIRLINEAQLKIDGDIQ